MTGPAFLIHPDRTQAEAFGRAVLCFRGACVPQA